MYGKLRGVGWRGLVAGACLALGAAGCARGELVSLPCTDYDGHCTFPGDKDAASNDSAPIYGPDGTNGLDAGPSRSPLCGTVGCYPGNPSACGATLPADAAGPNGPDLDASDAAADDDATQGDAAPGSPADASGDARLDGSSQSIDAASESSADVSLDPSSASDATVDIGATDEPKEPQSCYVKPSGASVVTECAPVGQGEEGSPCQDSSDCGALLACVDVNQNPVCRPFSCALPAKCPAGSGAFPQQVPLRVLGTTLPDVKVPVCLPNDHCVLLFKPNPCPQGQACAIVGAEGETTCVVPGVGKLGDACDDQAKLCAAGLVCSKLKNQCLQLCHIGAAMTECVGGTCQGGNRSLPDGFGICVGTSSDGG